MGKIVYQFSHHLFATIPRLGSRSFRSGFEHVPKTGGALLLPNHISHFDPPMMAITFPRYIHFMADKPLFSIPIYGQMLKHSFVFPIDRTKNDRAALRTAIERLKGGNVVCIYPEAGIRHGKTSVLGGAEMPVGTASLWKMMDVPVLPMVIIGTDQLYAWRNYFRQVRVFVRVGPPLPCDQSATREELRDRIVKAWHDLYHGMIRDYDIQPEELPHSAQYRWGRPEPVQATEA